MGEVFKGVAGVLAGFVLLGAQAVVIGGTSLGVVREHCVDLDQLRQGNPEVDSHWTYILWPPLPFSAVDPAGGCVRNTPLREGLAEVGIWELDSPEEQVREHLRKQLEGE
jgi:hypothetical protein